MRDIKFRAWHPEHGEMVYTGSTVFAMKREFSPFVFDVGFSHYPSDISEWKIMQFTGLKDKNGKVIYEGDIITGNWYDRDEPSFCVTGIVEYYQGWCAFIIHDHEGKVLSEITGMGAYHHEFEVLGNIHEHPELLP